jgi:hypothetical protein
VSGVRECGVSEGVQRSDCVGGERFKWPNG